MNIDEAIRIAVNTLRDDVASHMQAADIIEAAFERLRIEARQLDERAAIAVEVSGRRWSAVADELRKERDAAAAEVERLRGWVSDRDERIACLEDERDEAIDEARQLRVTLGGG